MWYAKDDFCQAPPQKVAAVGLTCGMWYAKNNKLREREKLSEIARENVPPESQG